MEKFDPIPYRLQTIKSMIDNDVIDSMISSDDEDNSSIKKEDIRELLPKKYIDFNKVVDKLGGRLLYIKSGSTGHTFKGVHLEKTDKPNYAVKVVAYPKKENYGDMYSVSRPENAELMVLKVLSKFVKKNQSPHIVLPITTFYTSIKTFTCLDKDDIVSNKKYEQFIKRYKKGDYYPNVSILISEWANSGDLLDFLKKNYDKFGLREWRVIIFQILSVLAIIQNKYPSFRHNDMKANNILLHKISKTPTEKSNKYRYKINGQIYVVPNIGYQIKLWDFDFACIPGYIDNTKVTAEWTDKINIKPIKNRYYDIHYFFNTLTRKGFFPEFWEGENVHTKIREFVLRIIPEHYRNGDKVSDRGRLLVDDEYLTPDEILKNDPLFKIMRID
ncbi:putative serine/threonine protein kinase [Chlorella virus XW01]|nr:putative serine/threonine protein kinase [Chlorella virus XW01]